MYCSTLSVLKVPNILPFSAHRILKFLIFGLKIIFFCVLCIVFVLYFIFLALIQVPLSLMSMICANVVVYQNCHWTVDTTGALWILKLQPGQSQGSIEEIGYVDNVGYVAKLASFGCRAGIKMDVDGSQHIVALQFLSAKSSLFPGVTLDDKLHGRLQEIQQGSGPEQVVAMLKKITRK